MGLEQYALKTPQGFRRFILKLVPDSLTRDQFADVDAELQEVSRVLAVQAAVEVIPLLDGLQLGDQFALLVGVLIPR